MALYKDRYRVESARMPRWDYGAPGYYFVTICTASMRPCFGRVHECACVLSPAGEIVADEWQSTGERRENVGVDAWVVMPNHVHGILVLASDEEENSNDALCVSPRTAAGSLGAIIGQFKAKCTRRIRAAGLDDFGWQSRFFDHVIRDDRSLYNIRKYIEENPARWEYDKYHVK